MKVGILCGGLGTRLQEETVVKPKPLVEIGGKPILWHIMKIFSAYGFNEFVLATGYKSEYIKDYFLNYHYRASNFTIHTKTGEVIVSDSESCEDWVVHVIDTGVQTQTGGRVKKIAQYMNGEPFMMTYGDGVAQIDIGELVKFHKKNNKIATVTAVHPPARFGEITTTGDSVVSFMEKPQISEGWINGGYFVLEPEIVDFIEGDETIFEREPLERLARKGELAAYKCNNFWQCMDTLRDKNILEGLWAAQNAPWKVW